MEDRKEQENTTNANEKEITDEWLYKVMPLVSERMIQELEQQAASYYQFSRRFGKKMEKLLKKSARRENIRRMGGMRFAAAAVACIVAVLGATGVYAVGKRFFTMKKSPSELNMTRYTYHTKDTPVELEMKKPGYVPEGYEMVEAQEDTLRAVYVYKDKEGRELSCVQETVLDGESVYVDNEYDWKEEIETAYGTVSVHGYDSGYVFGYLEYMNCIFFVDAVDMDTEEIRNIYDGWLQ